MEMVIFDGAAIFFTVTQHIDPGGGGGNALSEDRLPQQCIDESAFPRIELSDNDE